MTFNHRGSLAPTCEPVVVARLLDSCVPLQTKKAIAKVRRTQPAAYLKILALQVPREQKVEHSNPLKACFVMPVGSSCANDGHDTRALQHYLGRKNIQHAVRYTEMAPDRFKDFWKN